MALINSPPSSPVDSQNIAGRVVAVNLEWRNFFVSVYNICSALTLSGTTANRPTSLLWVGRTYFDTTISRPIWVLSLGPTVWINAAGAVV